ncbi:MAG TPA: NAD-dependent epimerase/dehydratase family protein [Beutenbergiaceae bacterium]|nr:NAD-dependent epimerase/dehydratase family protein [Beutenbergiaceae bacterium]
MNLLILGGTAWLGHTVATAARAHGHQVTCLARGESGDTPDGVQWVAGDRTSAAGYSALAGRTFDAVVDVSRQPGQARSAVDALAGAVGHWVFVSTGSVYADQSEPGGDESAALLPPAQVDEVTPQEYGPGKVACEQIVAEALGDRLLIGRSGLISGPGDHTGRAVSYAARARRRPDEPMLVPGDLDQPVQVVDVRDLSDFLLQAIDRSLTGTMDLVGPTTSLGEWVELSRDIGGHGGEVIAADPQWLLEQAVPQFAGPGSLALWLSPEMRGMMGRRGDVAGAAGLSHRPSREMLCDTLTWELQSGPDREVTGPGLTAERERELIAALRHL